MILMKKLKLRQIQKKKQKKLAWEMLRETIHECGFGVDVEEIEDEEEE